MPEFRRDPVIGRWVIIATERSKRPSDFIIPELVPEGDHRKCPFCPGNESMTPKEIWAYRAAGTKPNEEGWWLRVIPNKYPALIIEAPLDRLGIGIYEKMGGVGAHEVIVDSPEHNKSLSDLDRTQIAKIIWTYQERIIDLKQDSRFRYILIFKNHRSGAGASLDHPHSQLIATPIIPKRVMEELDSASKYYQHKNRCIFCTIIEEELKSTERIVAENNEFLAFVPYAARFPFEICIIPKKHKPDFCQNNVWEVTNLADILKITMLKLKLTLNDPPYNYIIHSMPLATPPDLKEYHWHIEIIPRIVKTAGFEWGTGFYINPTPPEDAARALRETVV